jgi:hypothetical protein
VGSCITLIVLLIRFTFIRSGDYSLLDYLAFFFVFHSCVTPIIPSSSDDYKRESGFNCF